MHPALMPANGVSSSAGAMSTFPAMTGGITPGSAGPHRVYLQQPGMSMPMMIAGPMGGDYPSTIMFHHPSQGYHPQQFMQAQQQQQQQQHRAYYAPPQMFPALGQQQQPPVTPQTPSTPSPQPQPQPSSAGTGQVAIPMPMQAYQSMAHPGQPSIAQPQPVFATTLPLPQPPSTTASTASLPSHLPIPPSVIASARLGRTKDKVKHSKSETRRRTRLRLQFEQLRDVSRSVKRDRFNILQTAVDKLSLYEHRIEQLEKENVKLKQASISILKKRKREDTTLTPTTPSNVDADSDSEAAASRAVLTDFPLSSLKYFADIPACLLSLNGSIIDSNEQFALTFQSQPQAPSLSLSQAPPQSLPGSIFSLTAECDLGFTLSMMQSLLTGLLDHVEADKQFTTLDGRLVPCHLTLWACKESGQNVSFVAVFMPQSAEFKEKRAALEQLQSSTMVSSGKSDSPRVKGEAKHSDHDDDGDDDDSGEEEHSQTQSSTHNSGAASFTTDSPSPQSPFALSSLSNVALLHATNQTLLVH